MVRKWILYILIITTFVLLIGVIFYHAYLSQAPPLYKLQHSGSWIYFNKNKVTHTVFRKNLFVSSQKIRNAWIRISADNSYKLYFNGALIGFDKKYNNTAGFQSTISELSQRIGKEKSFGVKDAPEIMMASYTNGLITTFYDLTGYVRAGKNVITVFTQTDRERASIVIEGEIETLSGYRIPILTDKSWKTNPVEETKNGVNCFDINFNDSDWSNASIWDPENFSYSVLDPYIFSQSMNGWWISHSSAINKETYFRKVLQLSEIPLDAWIRITAHTEYDLFLNGKYLGTGSSKTVNAYNIRPNLKRGKNVLAVALRSQPLDPELKLPEIFVDGKLRYDTRIDSLISDHTWVASKIPDNGWTEGSFAHNWEHVIETKKYDGYYPMGVKKYQYTPYYYTIRFRNYLMSTLIFSLLMGIVIIVLTMRTSMLITLNNTALSCLVPVILITIILLLKLRFGESQNKLIFYMPYFWRVVLYIILATFFGSVFYLTLRRKIYKPITVLKKHIIKINRYKYGIALIIIILIGLFLRLYNLGYQGFKADENVSIAAIHGIIETGAPISPSGIWYTRGPFYHYVMAMFGLVFGVGTLASRIPNVIVGTGFIIIIYIFCRDLFKSKNIALLTSFFISVDPWLIFFSRTARFYPFTQLFVTLAVFYFFKGFINNGSKKHQNLFFLTLTLAMLTQEVAITLIPAMLVCFLIFYREFSWRKDFNCLIGSVLMMLGIFTDLIVFSIRCLTTLVNVSYSTSSIITPHIRNISSFFVYFFVGDNRLHIVYSLFFLIGIPYVILKKDKVLFFLYTVVILTIATLTLLVVITAMRYTYSIYPLLIIIAVYVSVKMVDVVVDQFDKNQIGFRIKYISLGLIFCMFFISMQPLRLLYSFKTKINRDNTLAAEYVKERLEPGDVVITAVPQHTALTIGHTDYYIIGTLNFDEVYRNGDGRVIDRWGGGEYVTNVDKLRYIFEDSARAWIIIDYLEIERFPEQLIEFIDKNTSVEYHPYSSRVYLWDQSRGVFDDIFREGREKNLY